MTGTASEISPPAQCFAPSPFPQLSGSPAPRLAHSEPPNSLNCIDMVTAARVYLAAVAV